ncbi:NHL domain-containing protein, partial [Patulibacter sp. S7RM1-6]
APGDASVLAGGGAPSAAANVAINAGRLGWADGRLLVTDADHGEAWSVAPDSGALRHLAGVGASLADGLAPASFPTLRGDGPIAGTDDGTVYVASGRTIRRIAPGATDGGTVVVAADAMPDVEGDVGALAVDGEGGLLYALRGGNYSTGTGAILRLAPDATTPEVVAGLGDPDAAGATGPAGDAVLSGPTGLAVEPDGDVLVAEQGSGEYGDGNRVRRIAVGDDGVLTPDDTTTTIAGASTDGDGTGVAGGDGDGGAAVDAHLDQPRDVQALPDGRILIVDWTRVRVVATDGTITTVAGGGDASPTGATAEDADLTTLTDARMEGDTLYVVLASTHDGNAGVLAVDLDDPTATFERVAGTGGRSSGGDGTAATDLQLTPNGVAVAPDGATFVADEDGHRVLRIDPDTGTATRVLGAADGLGCVDAATEGRETCGADGRARETAISRPAALTVAPDGDLYVLDDAHLVRHVDLSAKDPDAWTVETIAGAKTGKGGIGDGGPAADAIIRSVLGMAVSPDGAYLYLASGGLRTVRRIELTGSKRIERFAGSSAPLGGIGDGGPATDAAFANPADVAVAADGTVFVADADDQRVRRIGTDGIITTVAGGGTGVEGDDDHLEEPFDPLDLGPVVGFGLALAPDGTIALSYGDQVRFLEPGGPIIRRVFGTGAAGYAGDEGRALDLRTVSATHVAFAPDGALVVADPDLRRVWRVESPARQLRIDGVSPGTVQAGGAAVQVTLTGGRTRGDVAVDAGAGVTVTDVRRDGPERVVATLRVSADAAPGARDVTLTTTLDG